MTSTQERVALAMSATAATVAPDTIRPLDLQADTAARFQPHHGELARRVHRILAPAAAAASVAAIAAVLLVISQTTTPGDVHRHHVKQGGVHPARGTATPPRYYVALTATRHPWLAHPLNVTVRATSSGQVIARITPPKPFTTFSWVSGASDDRTFVLAANKLLPPGGPYHGQHTWPQAPVRFYLLRLSAAGEAASLSALRITDVTSELRIGGIALSPDGAYLAVALGGRKISIYSVRTGAERTWSVPSSAVQNPYLGDLSWAAGDRALAFSSSGLGSRPSGLALLNSMSAGGDLLAHSTLAHMPGAGLSCAGNMTITLSGAAFACPVIKTPRKQAPGLSELTVPRGFAEFSVTTGKLLREFDSPAANGDRPFLLWVSPSGATLIANLNYPGRHVVIVSDRHVRPIPWAPQIAFGESPFSLPAW